MTPGKLSAWVLAARPRTLPAAMAPVIAGSALAYYDGVFRPGPALAALLGALLLQIGANFANDFLDYLKGTDSRERLGPTRVTTAGLLSLRAMQIGTGVVFLLAALCGLYLAWAAGWPVIVIGVMSILSALAYTGGPYPLGYNGLGEVFVFIFFGLAAVGGTYYVQARAFTLAAFAVSVPLGLLIVAILVVNNLRDLAGDRAAGKMTLAARYGEAWTRREYGACLALAYMTPFVAALAGVLPPLAVVSWLSAPAALNLARAVSRDSGRALNRSLGGTGTLTLAYALLLSLGLVLSKLFFSSL
jgi:1,4-dihydroxy-2-naphthoate octaprenyltransferase